jgi:elongation factor G
VRAYPLFTAPIYKETITNAVEQEGRFSWSVGGFGHYGHVIIRLSPGAPDSGFQFESHVTEDVIPARFIPSIEEEVRDRLRCGIFGYPIEDVRVELCGGSYHERDSSETVYKIAAAQAFHIAGKNAQPIVIERIMTVDMIVPGEHADDIAAGLALRRGVVLRRESAEPNELIRASVPLIEVLAYAEQLRAYGCATWSIRFDRYERVSTIPDVDEYLSTLTS